MAPAAAGQGVVQSLPSKRHTRSIIAGPHRSNGLSAGIFCGFPVAVAQVLACQGVAATKFFAGGTLCLLTSDRIYTRIRIYSYRGRWAVRSRQSRDRQEAEAPLRRWLARVWTSEKCDFAGRFYETAKTRIGRARSACEMRRLKCLVFQGFCPNTSRLVLFS